MSLKATCLAALERILPTRGTLFFLLITLGLLGAAYYLLLLTPPAPPAPPAAKPATAPPAAAAPKPAASDADTIILSLFNPSDSELTGFTREEALRERYRTIYLAAYLLQGCGENIDGIHASVAQLFSRDWATLRPAETARASTELNAIMQQANGTYSLLYQNTPCEKRNLPALHGYFAGLPKAP